jgi:excisionase family DNA binding protein
MKMFETLTPNEVAKVLKLHPFTVTRLAREGKLPAFKVGGVWRFRRDQFENWVAERTNGNQKQKQRRKK